MKIVLKILFLLFSIMHNLSAQQPAMWRLTDEQGLPSMTAYQILQDRKGFIWIGTQKGICRYDGRGFEYWEMDTLIDKEIVYLQEDRWNRIWFNNLSGQIGWIQNDRVMLLETEKPNTAFVPKRFELSENALHYFYAENGTYKLCKIEFGEDGALKKPVPFDGIYDAGIPNRLFFRGDTAIFGTIKFTEQHESVIKGINGKLINIQNENKINLPSKNIRAYEIQTLLDNGNLIVSDKKNVYLKTDTSLYLIDSFENPVVQNTKVIGNNLWVLTAAGARVFYLKNFELYRELLSGTQCNNVILDKEGNYWICTTNNGVFVVSALDFMLFQSGQGLSEKNDVNSLCLSKNLNQLVVGTSDGKLSMLHLSDGKFRHMELPSSGRITSLIEDENDNLWVGCDGGLYFITAEKRKKILLKRTGSFKKLLVDRHNRLWTAESFNVAVANLDVNLKKKSLLSAKPVLSKRSYGLCNDDKDRVWIGTTEGIFIFGNGKVSPFPNTDTQKIYRITSLRKDALGDIWAGTSGDGILRISNDVVIGSISTKNGLPSNNCLDIFTYHDYIFIGTDNGLAIFNIRDNTIKIIDDKDGLPSNEINCVVSDGTLVWVGTPKGLFQFPIWKARQNLVPPPVYIERFAINGQDTALSDRFRLDYRQNTIDISFIGLAYSAKGQETYHYRLLGLDEVWSTTGQRTARFHRLAPGDYEFQVAAANEDGIKSISPASIKFSIAAPWWKTTWFYSLAVLGLMLSTGGFVYWRLDDLRKHDLIERDLRERIHYLSVEALRTQMNPHFIYNALNAIQDFFVKKDHRSAIFYLSKFAQLIRQIFEFSKRNNITLAEELNFLNLYLELEKLRFEDRVNIFFSVAPEVEEMVDFFELPPLLIQPVIENCFKHGLMHKLEGGILNIKFEKEGEEGIRCVVEDNGVGRAKTAELNKWRSKNNRIGGLEATRERLNVFHDGSEKSKFQYLQIEDLSDAEGNPAGTRVTIFIKPQN